MKRAIAAIFFVVLWAASASAQSAPQTPPESAGAQTGAAEAPADAGARIDEILQGEEAVLQGISYTYDPGNRRDPFKSLEVAQNRPEVKGPLPEGIAGLLIDEIDLTGIFRTSRGFIAQVSAPNKNRSYLLRDGDQLYDGDVVRITQTEIVFKQIVNDPTVLKPFREVVKKLSP
jgi:Tfp pilus assembly protein PilP